MKSSNSVRDSILPYYRSGRHNLKTEFFAPCLGSCSAYDRAVGYYTSYSLAAWIAGVTNQTVINVPHFRVIASPLVTENDCEVMKRAILDNCYPELLATKVESLIDDIVVAASLPNDGLYSRLFAWMIVNGKLDLKFAFPAHTPHPGLYHEKIGVFIFADGEKVAFTGSANETQGGLETNFESIDVYCSWIAGESARVAQKSDQFGEAWRNEAIGLTVLGLSPSSVLKLKAVAPDTEYAPTELPRENRSQSASSESIPLWDHQKAALQKFLVSETGILEMATGSGKTRTSIAIFQALFWRRDIDWLIVTVEGPDLLEQWGTELSGFINSWQNKLTIYRHYGRFHDIGSFILGASPAAILVSRPSLPKLLQRFSKEKRKRTLIIHDEVHGLGSPSAQEELAGLHKEIRFRLGLSATPERFYDEEGNTFISHEIGEVIYRFTLSDAIENGVLCEFDYHTLEYELTQEDKKRLQAVYSRDAMLKKQGRPMTKEQLWIALARVYKTAEMKLELFSEYVAENPSILNNSIIFVETIDYGNRLLPLLHSHNVVYRTFYGDDEADNLQAFGRGSIDCLVTCHRLSQGIDLPALRNVVLFASARSTLETTQRIGRCLRKDPNDHRKRAVILDFIRVESERGETDQEESADRQRAKWLSELSQTKIKEDNNGT